jgi:hypothetical protein
MRSMYLFVGVFGALIVGAVLAQSVHGGTTSMYNNNKPAINTIAGIAGPIAMKDNATAASLSAASASNTTAASNNVTNNNVTAASGNNGHIYRGGAAAGSGGE